MELFYSPDEYQGTKFLGEFANSLFVKDMLENRIIVEPHYVILHCKFCEERQYATMKENCLSGGRYCALPARDDLKGERILMQNLYHICVEKYAKKKFETLIKWQEYLYQYDKVCA